MALLERVNETITTILTTDLAEHIADHHGLDIDAVTDTIKAYLECIVTYSPTLPSKRDSIFAPAKNTGKAANICQFRITRGNKEGRVCGTNIRGGGTFCSKHRNRKVQKYGGNGNSDDSEKS